jgi:hypothetical protein
MISMPNYVKIKKYIENNNIKEQAINIIIAQFESKIKKLDNQLKFSIHENIVLANEERPYYELIATNMNNWDDDIEILNKIHKIL